MEFYEVIKKRRSYRQFKEQMPEKDKIEKIMNAARLAPTWANMQGVQYIIVQDKEKVNQIWKAIGQKTKFEDAPMYVVGVIAEKDSGTNSNGEKYYPIDFGICFEHLILAATAENLATCWIGWFNEEKVKEVLKIPAKYRVLGLTPLGYPQNYKGEIKSRKTLDEILHYNEF